MRVRCADAPDLVDRERRGDEEGDGHQYRCDDGVHTGVLCLPGHMGPVVDVHVQLTRGREVAVQIRAPPDHHGSATDGEHDADDDPDQGTEVLEVLQGLPGEVPDDQRAQRWQQDLTSAPDEARRAGPVHREGEDRCEQHDEGAEIEEPHDAVLEEKRHGVLQDSVIGYFDVQDGVVLDFAYLSINIISYIYRLCQ